MIYIFRKNWIKFIIGLIWLFSFFLYLFNSGYTIAVVSSITGLIILFFYLIILSYALTMPLVETLTKLTMRSLSLLAGIVASIWSSA